VRRSRLATLTVLFLAAAATPRAQWPAYPTPDLPRSADGSVRLDAPAPRTADGRPDLSGVWMNFRASGREGELEGGRGRSVNSAFFDETPPGLIGLFRNIGQGVEGGLPFQPWAAELRATRMATDSRDNPDAHCLPIGLMQYHTHPDPRRIVQTDDLVVIIYESNYGLRTIFLDGRPAPDNDPQPWWFGYSRGWWEGDALVVETTHLRDGGWLDIDGSPLTDQATITERFRRPTVGALAIEVTVDDPRAYTRPWTVTINQRLMPDEALMEFICNENQKFGGRDAQTR
jgi:hypothetical protein